MDMPRHNIVDSIILNTLEEVAYEKYSQIHDNAFGLENGDTFHALFVPAAMPLSAFPDWEPICAKVAPCDISEFSSFIYKATAEFVVITHHGLEALVKALHTTGNVKAGTYRGVFFVYNENVRVLLWLDSKSDVEICGTELSSSKDHVH